MELILSRFVTFVYLVLLLEYSVSRDDPNINLKFAFMVREDSNSVVFSNSRFVVYDCVLSLRISSCTRSQHATESLWVSCWILVTALISFEIP